MKSKRRANPTQASIPPTHVDSTCSRPVTSGTAVAPNGQEVVWTRTAAYNPDMRITFETFLS